MTVYLVAFTDRSGEEYRVVIQSDNPLTASFKAGQSAAKMGVIDCEVVFARPMSEKDWYETLSCGSHRQASPG